MDKQEDQVISDLLREQTGLFTTKVRAFTQRLRKDYPELVDDYLEIHYGFTDMIHAVFASNAGEKLIEKIKNKA